MKNKKAFTFLEVMFGLAIVGLISSMVIPIFYNSYNDRVKGTQLKKVVGQISLATEAIMADERGMDSFSDDTMLDFESTEVQTTDHGFYLTSAGVKTSNATQGAEYFLNKYFKHIMVNCGSGGTNNCIGLAYRSPEKKALGTIPESYYCIKTVNNAAICMKYDEDNHVTRVIVDVNAAEKPNITGSDTFVMYITSDGHLKDIDDDASNCNKNRTTGLTVENFAAGCFTKILSNGWKMPK